MNNQFLLLLVIKINGFDFRFKLTIETKHSNIGESFRNYALVRTFLNEGEKERKERGDKEMRSNVYGGRKEKKKKPMSESWRKKRENESTSSTREKKKEKKGEIKR